MAFATIPKNFIDELINRSDIVEVIDSRVPLKKIGRNYTACCPFHNEKTPSFNVNPDKQFYYCFGCGAHGTAISFLMDYEQLKFTEAVEELAHRLGLTVPYDSNTANRNANQRALYQWLEDAARYYQQALINHYPARAYLQQRGLTDEVIARFRLGYAPSGWDNLLRALGGEAARAPLLETGMLIQKEHNERVYDRFRERIMFPIMDRTGRILGFGGRTLGNDKPKYLNSPETPLFHKGQELYGLYQAVERGRTPEKLLIVEGYLDVIALAQHGINHTVATLGTAISAAHLERLFRISSQLIFCFDGDHAGRTAAWRALELSLPELHEQRDIRFLILPEGEDPDTLIRTEGSAAFHIRMQQAQPIIEYLLAQLNNKIDSTRTDRQARIVELARPFLNKLTAGIYQTLLIKELAEIARLTPEQLVNITRTQLTPTKKNTPVINDKNALYDNPSSIRTALGLLLAHPELAKTISSNYRNSWQNLDISGANLLAELINLLHEHPEFKLAAILEHWRGTETEAYLAQLAQWTPLTPEEGMVIELKDALARLEHQALEQEINQLINKARFSQLENQEKQRLSNLLALKK